MLSEVGDGPLRLSKGHGGLRGLASPNRIFNRARERERERERESNGIRKRHSQWRGWWRVPDGLPWPPGSGKCMGGATARGRGVIVFIYSSTFFKNKKIMNPLSASLFKNFF